MSTNESQELFIQTSTCCHSPTRPTYDGSVLLSQKRILNHKTYERLNAKQRNEQPKNGTTKRIVSTWERALERLQNKHRDKTTQNNRTPKNNQTKKKNQTRENKGGKNQTKKNKINETKQITTKATKEKNNEMIK